MQQLLRKITIIMVLSLTMLNAQGAAPTIMVLPDKTWCTQNNFVNRIEKQGKTRIIEQYEDAFINSTDLKNVKTTLNKLFADRGFPLQDAEAALGATDEEEDEEEFMESEESGDGVAMTPYDMLMNKCKPDITLKVGWEVNTVGFDQCITYRIEAIDSYSNKSVAVANGTGPMMKRNVPLPVMLEQSVLDKMEGLTDQLMKYFADVQANGREISLRVRMWEGAPFSLSSEYGGQELSEIIYNWISDNTVNHQFTEANSSPKAARYTQVRVPLKDQNGRPMQARQYVDQLRKYLQNTYSISSANRTSGLGSGVLVLGGK